jgi:hypothetical protein
MLTVQLDEGGAVLCDRYAIGCHPYELVGTLYTPQPSGVGRHDGSGLV